MHKVEVCLRVARRLQNMDSKELKAAQRDCLGLLERVASGIESGEQFSEEHERRLAERLRNDPQELHRLRAALAVSDRRRRAKDPDDWFLEANAHREDVENRWDAKCDEIRAQLRGVQWLEKRVACAPLPKLPTGTRVAELILYGEHQAGVRHNGPFAEPAMEAQLRQQLICTLAWFIAELSDPMAGTSTPWRTSKEPLFSPRALAILRGPRKADASRSVAEAAGHANGSAARSVPAVRKKAA